jgi:hypothetical protein
MENLNQIISKAIDEYEWDNGGVVEKTHLPPMPIFGLTFEFQDDLNEIEEAFG